MGAFFKSLPIYVKFLHQFSWREGKWNAHQIMEEQEVVVGRVGIKTAKKQNEEQWEEREGTNNSIYISKEPASLIEFN